MLSKNSQNSNFDNNIEVIKRPSGELVLMIDSEIVDWGDTADNGSFVLLGKDWIRVEYKEEVIGESRGVYFKIIEGIKDQGDLIKVILMPNGEEFPVLNISPVVDTTRIEEENNVSVEDEDVAKPEEVSEGKSDKGLSETVKEILVSDEVKEIENRDVIKRAEEISKKVESLEGVIEGLNLSDREILFLIDKLANMMSSRR